MRTPNIYCLATLVIMPALNLAFGWSDLTHIEILFFFKLIKKTEGVQLQPSPYLLCLKDSCYFLVELFKSVLSSGVYQESTVLLKYSIL